MNGPFHDAVSCRCVFVMSIHLYIHQFLAHDAVASSVEEKADVQWPEMEQNGSAECNLFDETFRRSQQRCL